MTTILEQIRASNGEPSDELMSARQSEIAALRPKLTCCARANRFTKAGVDGKWYPKALKYEEFTDGQDCGDVFFCVACGTKLPDLQLKQSQAPTLCVVTDGGYYCDTCGERIQSCWCDPLESAYEVVGPGLFYIQNSRSYVGNDVLWWRPNSDGYTCQIDEAGLYDEAFCRGVRSTDKIWRWEDIGRLATRVIDAQRMHDILPVVFDPLWAPRRPDLVALWRVVFTKRGSAEVPECVAKHMLSFRNWRHGDVARVALNDLVECDRWSCAREIMLECIKKAVASS